MLLADDALRRVGIVDEAADEVIVEALRIGDEVCEKPWRGLMTLCELITYGKRDSGALDPTELVDTVRRAMTADIRYTRMPGREWIVRDHAVARALLRADGRVQGRGGQLALSQSGASVAPGALANNPQMLDLAGRYLKPIEVYLNGMVAKSGDEHRRHRSVFQGFFRKAEVLDEIEAIESTIAEILDEAERVAEANDGRFDFVSDVAAKFPIRIICHFMGIPASDATMVQHWAEASVRALDAGAGLSLASLEEGDVAARAFTDYLAVRLARARAEARCGDGPPARGVIAAVAGTTELDDVELVSNLAGITFAGFETTTGLLALGFRELLTKPEQLDHLRSQLVSGPPVTVNGSTIRTPPYVGSSGPTTNAVAASTPTPGSPVTPSCRPWRPTIRWWPSGWMRCGAGGRSGDAVDELLR